MKNLYIKYPLFALCFGMMLLSCEKKKEVKVEQNKEVVKSDSSQAFKEITFTADQYNLSEIELGKIENRNLNKILKLTGIIEAGPNSIATVSALLGGYVKTAGLLPGRYVSKGQFLASIENPEFISLQQEYLESVAQLQYLSQEFKRQKDLRAENVNSAKTYQKASSEYNVMRARIAGLEQQLGLVGISARNLSKRNKISRTASIYAPISGYIKSSNTNIGKYVAPTDVLFEIVNNNNLHIVLNAFEKDLNKIQVGQDVRFSLSNEDNYKNYARVNLVGKSANDKKLIPVHCDIVSKENFVPGMYVKAWLEYGNEETTAVPSDAIVQYEGANYIIIESSSDKNNHTFQLIQVAKGTEQEAFTAIELPKGKDTKSLKIVTKNAYTILSAIKNSEEVEE